MNQSVTPKLVSASTYVVAAILVLIPFHGFLSVWVGSSFGVYDAARVWKELLIVLLFLPVGYLVWRDRSKTKNLPVLWLIAAYVALHILAACIALAMDKVTPKAAAYGLIVNLRFVLFFVLCAATAARSPWLRAHWQKLVFIPATVVVTFGLLQLFVLPSDFLTHFGYGPHTIAPFETVDQKPDYLRAQSTLRGPNPLGSYLVVVIGATLAVLLGEKPKSRKRLLLGTLLVGSVLLLFYTYSRSAYIGAAVTATVTCWLLMHSIRLRLVLLAAAAFAVLLFGVLVVALRDNDGVQNVLFHTNEHSLSFASSNQDRALALESGLRDVAHEPLGRGPGTAGPASVYNNEKVRIAENYYLQIGQEVGWIGLVLFVAILVAVAGLLLRLVPSPLAVALLTSLAGISVVNLFVHAWTDDSLSLLWWGLAAIAILDSGNVRRKSISGRKNN